MPLKNSLIEAESRSEILVEPLGVRLKSPKAVRECASGSFTQRLLDCFIHKLGGCSSIQPTIVKEEHMNLFASWAGKSKRGSTTLNNRLETLGRVRGGAK